MTEGVGGERTDEVRTRVCLEVEVGGQVPVVVHGPVGVSRVRIFKSVTLGLFSPMTTGDPGTETVT